MHKKTPIFYAVEANSVESVKLLLSKGASVEISCLDKRTPLHDAAERSSNEIVESIIKAGADVNAVNWQQRSPLHLAAAYGRIESVEALVDAGADINAQDDNGFTPLHHAAKNNHEEIVQYLISSGCDHQILNNDGLKAQEIAPEPLKSHITDFMVDCLMTSKRGGEEPLLTPGLCIMCQQNAPVFTFGPCTHVQICDTCYLKNKEILKKCPICGKNLKRVMVTAEELH